MSSTFDVAIIGGGIVGMATAMALTSDRRLRLIVLEAEDRLAAHQTGHNSGVIHSGLYYKPGSAKARNCVEGRELLYRFCQENGIPHERCGKLVVAVDSSELPALAELERRGRANGLQGLRRLDAAGVREYEPHVRGIAGLHVPATGIVDYKAVTNAYAAKVREAGGDIRLHARVLGCKRETQAMILETTGGEVRCRQLINCGGLQADRVARMCGVDPGVQIIPFRGEFYELRPERRRLVRNLVYPVPDPRLPFLGVHLTRLIHGGIEAGPNAVLAFRREGYRLGDISWRDLGEMLRFSGFWKMARRFWRSGLEEMHRSFSRRLFWKSLRRLVPDLGYHDIEPAGAGVRAQAVTPEGKLVDDFHIVPAERMIHVLNAPSPAATASISIGRTIAELSRETFVVPPSGG
jgi:(S)-2-hydroxyglutarate dehydrogenase